MLEIKELPEKYENIVIPLLNICPKLSLGGSLALYMVGLISEYDFGQRHADLDISLSGPLTEEELYNIKDFFNLEFLLRYGDYEFNLTDQGEIIERKPKDISYFLNQELIQLYSVPNENDDPIVIDLFNREYMRNVNDIFWVKYKDYELKLTMPHIILSYKYRYSINPYVGKQFKHLRDLEKIPLSRIHKIMGNIKFVHYENNHKKSKFVWWDPYWKRIQEELYSKDREVLPF